MSVRMYLFNHFLYNHPKSTSMAAFSIKNRYISLRSPFLELLICLLFCLCFYSPLILAQEAPPVSSDSETHTDAKSLNTEAAQANLDESNEEQDQDQEKAKRNNDQDWSVSTDQEQVNFDIEIICPDEEIKEMLEKYLDLYKYRVLDDLSAFELQRILEATQKNIRSLTGTKGYFSPEITVDVISPEQRTPPNELPLIKIGVEPGTITTVQGMELNYEGDITQRDEDILIKSFKRRMRWSWAMREGDPFSQTAWSTAKSNMLSRLTAQYYPAGKIVASKAAIDLESNSANLSVTLDSGPRFYLGDYNIIGLKRYDEKIIRNFARLEAGDDYLQDDLLKAQQRLAESGYFDTAYVFIFPNDPDPENAKINIYVVEAYKHTMTVGPGYSTDHGMRLTFDYRNNQIPILGWQSVTSLRLDQTNQKAETTLSAIPNDNYWRTVAYGKLENLDRSDEKTKSIRLRFGHSLTAEEKDKSYYLQYDRARLENANGIEDVQAFTLNTAHIWRRFNSMTNPRKGWGLSLDFGVGSTFGNTNTPFVRINAKALKFLPFEKRRDGRILLRGEVGAILAKRDRPMPSTLKFRTGGDTTVRGYAYRYIGVNEANNVTTAGRYMFVGSIEYRRPILKNDRMTGFEWAIFADTGAVTNDYDKLLNFYHGVGAGVRWNSPIGPLNVDLAYGLKTESLRLHFTMGFFF